MKHSRAASVKFSVSALVMQYFRGVKGVLAVEYDHIIRLTDLAETVQSPTRGRESGFGCKVLCVL